MLGPYLLYAYSTHGVKKSKKARILHDAILGLFTFDVRRDDDS